MDLVEIIHTVGLSLGILFLVSSVIIFCKIYFKLVDIYVKQLEIQAEQQRLKHELDTRKENSLFH